MKRNRLSEMLFFFTFLFIGYSYAQPPFSCGNTGYVEPSEPKSVDCTPDSPEYLNYYRYQENYVPQDSDGIKTVRLSFHVWNDDNGQGQFSDDINSRQTFHQIVDWINGWHSNVGPPSDPVPGASTINDTKIRFELLDENIYLYKLHFESKLGYFYSN